MPYQPRVSAARSPRQRPCNHDSTLPSSVLWQRGAGIILGFIISVVGNHAGLSRLHPPPLALFPAVSSVFRPSMHVAVTFLWQKASGQEDDVFTFSMASESSFIAQFERPLRSSAGEGRHDRANSMWRKRSTFRTRCAAAATVTPSHVRRLRHHVTTTARCRIQTRCPGWPSFAGRANMFGLERR